ncbi:Leucine-rich repeat receptor protein kinase ems1 [Thalictrum thalictroides]|uniref:Leucine-rich repeat receptor protein kinase ems1 n=1 Tax=Thalictrum thalictroides TaxID=46969 RepID=A0A7J6V1C3_THATH|nr:Leucine-rich repeat receptor protein kinase ems1 [Thalictrum thalictroides]
MDKTSTWIPLTTLVFVLLLISSASAITDASDGMMFEHFFGYILFMFHALFSVFFDLISRIAMNFLISEYFVYCLGFNVSALQDLYRTLSYPAQLTGWKSKGGDPCEEQWKGISCNGSSIIYIKLNGLDLGGYLGEQLNLMNLKQLDLSSNHIQGEIPSLLPPNATTIDLSCNDFNMSIPYSLNSMIRLRHLNFSHNALTGPIGNVFTSLHNLKQMDLSFNNFTGDLPSSFGNLRNLTGLYLQNNKFTCSVIFFANLPLVDLNIQDNHFSGVIPKNFSHVPNIKIEGNAFEVGTFEYLLQRFGAVIKLCSVVDW